MRGRHGAVVGIVLAVLGASACTAEKAERPKEASRAPAPKSLREGLLTQDGLPEGFKLGRVLVDPTSTAAAGTPTAIADLRCDELEVDEFVTTHAPPVEYVAADLERTSADAEDMGWFGRESLDRYAPGRAAEVMDAIRATAQRCGSYLTTFTDGTKVQETASVAPAGVPADDSFLIHFTSTFPGDSKPFEEVSGFARLGDVVLVVKQAPDQKPPTDSQKVLAAAVKAYVTAPARPTAGTTG
ncbi:hypothetical protein ACIBCA_31890 [Kitasatospora sp. NPDC051170]|uniref:hypothetical protein n=1 Tax=Kitasatospora sp. NPDC051170 TaxID=3364056 RepID=UPI0037BA6D02